jgi:hypothetical protein
LLVLVLRLKLRPRSWTSAVTSFLEHYYNIHIARRSSRAFAAGAEEPK